MPTATPQTYELKCTILDIEPPIWRSVRVPGDLTLSGLHTVLQTLFSWDDAHLHGFIVKDVEYGPLDEDFEGDDDDIQDDSDVTLDSLELTAGAKFHYTYDFGDNWEVDIVVEKIEEATEELLDPVCLAGERAAPPEDVGGIPGYENLVAVMKKKRHPQRRELIEWLGYEFDPEEFDIDEINEELSFDEDGPLVMLPWIARAQERAAIAEADATAPDATEEELRALFAAVAKYREAKPWVALPDDMNCAIANPETGEIGYCAVLGNFGELEGLMVYRSELGYDSLWYTKGLGSGEPLDLFISQDCIGVTFGSRDELSDEEHAQIKSLGLKFRGQTAWPAVRAFDPGFVPRRLNGAETRYFTVCLEQIVEFAKELKATPDMEIPLDPEEPLPLRVLRDGVWVTDVHEPALSLVEMPEILPNSEVLEAFEALPLTGGSLELDFWPLPGMPLADANGKLVVPIIVMGADPVANVPLGMQTTAFVDLLPAVISLIEKILRDVGMRPQHLIVRREELGELLLPLGARLDFDIEVTDVLPTIMEIQAGLLQHIMEADLEEE